MIDAYDAKGAYLFSFGRSYAAGEGMNWRTESFLGGGSLDLLGDGRVAYTQQVPYRITLFSSVGEKLISTDAGGKDFLELPPEPDYTKKTFKMGMTGSSTGIVCLGNRLLNCAIRGIQDPSHHETLFTLYDDNLNLLARAVTEGFEIVVGSDTKRRVFIFTRDGDVPQVKRCRVEVE